jgi:hypothetical protein
LPDVPVEIEALAQERAQARSAHDFAAADALRNRMAEAGWLVVDGADGYELKPKPPYDVVDSLAALPDNTSSPDARRATVSLLVDGWPDDVRTCVGALLQHTLDLGNVDGAGDALHEFAAARVEEWHVLSPLTNWAAARNALLRADVARIHVWCDLSTVLNGDALTPLLDAIDRNDDVVAAGWRGVNVDLADEWRSFTEAGAGDVDAILGYLFAFRRAAGLAAGGAHSKARFYRNADIEFSFALREAGGPGARLVIPPGELPVEQGRHHGYHDSDPAYRDAESQKTYNRFLQRYRGRKELLAPRA